MRGWFLAPGSQFCGFARLSRKPRSEAMIKALAELSVPSTSPDSLDEQNSCGQPAWLTLA